LAEALAKTMNNIPDPGHLADTIAGIIVSEARDRQRLLEEISVERRLDEVIGRLTDLLATVGSMGPDGEGQLN
ncbi:MAG: LON peptidase substrate-binding domain-containing protein, partial [Myxococcota bacterium]